ncbi:T9SS type A sorting domain-containing protein [Taibaiella soli]|nr:T9SS type A sorting domain-containing protein [Taibaiella soli]
MRKALFFLFTILSFYAQGQTNILQPSHFEQTISNSFLEIGNYYYFLTFKESGLFGTYSPYSKPLPTEFTLFKIDKYSLAVIDSAIAMGDTKQDDSVVYTYPIFMRRSPSDGIYLFYQKTLEADSSVTPVRPYDRIIYCTAFDTMLTPIIPEKKIWSESEHQPTTNTSLYTATFIGNRIFLGFAGDDSTVVGGNYYSVLRYAKLDTDANLLNTDTLGDKNPLARHQVDRWLTRLIPYKNQILFLATNLSYNGNAVDAAELYLADTNMHLTDSFFRPFYTTYPNDTVSVYNVMSNMTALPTGGLIEGYPGINSTYPTRSILFKSYASTGFEPVKSLHLYAHDSDDHYHSTSYSIYEVIAYNKSDNLIYFAERTHTFTYVDPCNGNQNYLQITCADTNLNLKWTKYIFSDSGYCILPEQVTPCDGRSGAIIAGEKGKNYSYSVTSFAYRLDSATTTGITNTDGLTVRDRFRIYPNPATDVIYADDIFDRLKKITIYDMQGRLVITRALHSGKNEITLGQLPSGIYLINLQTEDGEEHREKFIVR